MCGIYGQWALDGRPLDLDSVQRATTLLRHRGPDDEGYFLGDTRAGRFVHGGGRETSRELGLPSIASLAGESFDLAFGFRRLSILDLSPRGHQPMESADGRFCIVFNGEVYNYRELRAELAGRGYGFRGGSDTEVVLAAYQEWGPGCLHRFNGMWALAVWDRAAERLFLARDRFGVKPLFYRSGSGSFAFASEIKALVGPHGVPFRPNPRAVYEYLESGILPSPRGGETFFEGVAALPPGHHMWVERSGVRTAPYYELPTEAGASRGGADEAVAGYRELLEDSVRLRLRSDVPVGSCLSGGLDSSSIVCIVNRLIAREGVAAEQVGERQKTFSAVYESTGRYNEREHAEKVLAETRAEGNFVFPTADGLVADLEQLVWHQDEPFGSTSIFAQWCVMSTVRERGVTVLLDGQGADEALAGYRPFDIFTADLLRRGRVGGALAAGREIRRTAGVATAPLLARALVRQLPERYLAGLRRGRAAVASSALRPEFREEFRSRRRYAPVNRHLHEHLRELLLETSLPHLLRYEDRNSMAFSVEGRVPFLDYRLVEYSLREAFRWCIHDGWTKWVLREAMRDTVPEEIVWRRDKVGFETPERSWLTAWLDRAGEEQLGPGARSAAYLDAEEVRRYLKSWREGAGDDRRVWRWINLELWLRAYA
jgi:asparagine synthase (glutamine-hydrolysing)